MTTNVIDASIAVKWFFEESYREAAKRFLQSDLIKIAPDLIIVEYANALHKKVILKQLSPEDADNGFMIFMKRINQLFNKLYPANDLIHRAFNLSKDLKRHPIPDCLYLALAEKENAQLVTADRKFYDLTTASKYRRLIVWVEEFPDNSK